MVELEIRWPSADHAEVPIGTPLNVREVTGLSQSEADSLLANVAGYTGLIARGSSQGKGSSGPAFALVVELERFGTDAAALIAIGSALWQLIRRVARKVESHFVVEDPNTLGALAAAENQQRDPFDFSELEELRYISTVPVTASPGIGTDPGDIWAACFRTKTYDAVVVFVTRHGTWLGRVRVPAEYCFDAEGHPHHRTSQEIQEWWS